MLDIVDPTVPLVKNMLLLDSDGKRIAVKYYGNDWPTVSSQANYEKSVFSKTNRTIARSEAEITMFDDVIVVYKFIGDLMFFVTGSQDENELILYQVLQGFYEAISLLLRNAVEKKTVLENLDLVLLVMDETVDGGVILETDATTIAGRVAMRGPDDQMSISEQTLSKAFASAKEQIARQRGFQCAAEANKAPSQLEEVAKRVAREQPDDDGRVIEGRTLSGPEARHGRYWPFITGFPFPLGPILTRQTVRHEVVPDTIWTFDQEQTFALTNVSTVVRMTVVKLKSGGLFVYAPIAPTRECMDLLLELDRPVRYIVLTTHAYEHKVFVPSFQRRFPLAQVYYSPKQWAFPLPLPLPLLGIFGAKQLPPSGGSFPWSDELEHACLAEFIGAAPYSEAVFYHKASKTLLVTDAVVYISSDPPEVINRAKLERAGKDNLFVKTLYGKDKPMIPQSIEEQQRIGWARMSLLVLYFSPDHLRNASNFEAVSNKLICSPVTQILVFTKIPGAVREWVDLICKWDFKRVISAHFNSPADATPADFRKAFDFVYRMNPADDAEEKRPLFQSWVGKLRELPENAKISSVRFPEGDVRALQTLDSLIRASGFVYRKPKY
ncbi:g7564 [Coccomyxa viridis]|uniref:G7564 protein n=1 Tax=Coccomyxa viridis TaxID=1274662 RepID=A0ABP1FY57_9CHLO